MELSVVIPTIEERLPYLLILLKHLLSQEMKPYEVIVVGDYSAERYSAISSIKEYYREKGITLKFVNVKKGLSPAAHRNIGVKRASCKYIALIDDDALPVKTWTLQIFRSLEEGYDIVGGPIKPLFISPPPKWWDEAVLGPYVATGNEHILYKHLYGIWTCNMGIRRSLFHRLNGFDEKLGFTVKRRAIGLYGEDIEFMIRACQHGARIVFNRNAIVYHILPPSRLTYEYYKRRAISEGYSKKVLSSINAHTSQMRTIINALKDFSFGVIRILYLSIRRRNPLPIPYGLIFKVHELTGWLL